MMHYEVAPKVLWNLGEKHETKEIHRGTPLGNGRRGVKVQMAKPKVQMNAKKAMFKRILTFEVIVI
ncbi:MAG TPA: hypothetical protein DCO77_02470 [Nitrospiraceae bacterium]|nr:hypothetical protein [Nitrospiraceae bacterium]